MLYITAEWHVVIPCTLENTLESLKNLNQAIFILKNLEHKI